MILLLKAGDNITVKVMIDSSKKAISFNLFSPSLNRVVTFEEINGVELLDVRLEEELKSSNHEAEEEDAIITIDLVRIWAKENNYAVSHAWWNPFSDTIFLETSLKCGNNFLKKLDDCWDGGKIPETSIEIWEN